MARKSSEPERERDDPDYRDAGQQYADRVNEEAPAPAPAEEEEAE